jgi:hypothetical protein
MKVQEPYLKKRAGISYGLRSRYAKQEGAS